MIGSIAKSSLFDVIILGAGPVGLSSALHLAKHGINKILMLEHDLSYRRCSALLSAGGIRQQFSLPENIQMSKYGSFFLKEINSFLNLDPSEDPRASVQFQENGYLFLATTCETLIQNNKVQRECGVEWTHLATPEELSAKYPWLNTAGLKIGSYSEKMEGYFDPWGFLYSMKKKVLELGVEIRECTVTGALFEQSFSREIFKISHLKVKKGNCEEIIEVPNVVVNAAGAWSGSLFSHITESLAPAQFVVPLPVKRRKRCIFQVHCPGSYRHLLPPTITPLVVDPTGVYFRPLDRKPGNYIVGVSPAANTDFDCEDSDIEIVDFALFDDIIWPTLSERVPAFEELKVLSSWAGFYDYNTLDQNGIIGFHPQITNLLFCTGFSGHGLQHAPAAGQSVAEILLYGKFKTIDLRRFGFDRVITKQPVIEINIV